jgi:hypothetical protein
LSAGVNGVTLDKESNFKHEEAHLKEKTVPTQNGFTVVYRLGLVVAYF